MWEYVLFLLVFSVSNRDLRYILFSVTNYSISPSMIYTNLTTLFAGRDIFCDVRQGFTAVWTRSKMSILPFMRRGDTGTE